MPSSQATSEPVAVDQYERRNRDELVAMCDDRGITLTPVEELDAQAIRERLRQDVSEIVKEKRRVRRKRPKLTDEERRRQGIEQQILEACTERPMGPREVARSIYRNVHEVRGMMMELVHRGRLVSKDGYATFRTVRAC